MLVGEDELGAVELFTGSETLDADDAAGPPISGRSVISGVA